MCSLSECSLLEESHSGVGRDIDSVINLVVAGLNRCLDEYKENEKENSSVLYKLGYDINTLPSSLRNQSKDIFKDSEVFQMRGLDGKQLVTINHQQVLDSLIADVEVAEINRLGLQLNMLLTQLQNLHVKLQRKLEIEKTHAVHLEEKANEKAVEQMMFKRKLETFQIELKNLQQAVEKVETPKYSLEKIKDLYNELTTLKEERALAKTKLNKYNNLSLSEKEAATQLMRLCEEMKNVDSQIKEKINC